MIVCGVCAQWPMTQLLLVHLGPCIQVILRTKNDKYCTTSLHTNLSDSDRCLEAFLVTGQYKGDMVVHNCISVVQYGTGTRLSSQQLIGESNSEGKMDQEPVSRPAKVLIVITREAVGQRSRQDHV